MVYLSNVVLKLFLLISARYGPVGIEFVAIYTKREAHIYMIDLKIKYITSELLKYVFPIIVR